MTSRRQPVGQVHGQAAARVAAHVGPEGLAVLIELALAHRHYAAAQPAVYALHVSQQPVERQRPLRKVDQVRGVRRTVARQRGGRHDPAGIPAEHLHEFHLPGERAVVRPDIPHRAGEEARRRSVAGSVIGFRQVVIDGLGNSDHLEIEARRARQGGDLGGRAHGPVAARVEKAADVARPEDIEQPLAAGRPTSRREVPSAERAPPPRASRRGRA